MTIAIIIALTASVAFPVGYFIGYKDGHQRAIDKMVKVRWRRD